MITFKWKYLKGNFCVYPLILCFASSAIYSLTAEPKTLTWQDSVSLHLKTISKSHRSEPCASQTASSVFNTYYIVVGLWHFIVKVKCFVCFLFFIVLGFFKCGIWQKKDIIKQPKGSEQALTSCLTRSFKQMTLQKRKRGVKKLPLLMKDVGSNIKL